MAHTLRLTASSQLRLAPLFPCGPLSLSPHRQLLTNHLPFGCISLLAFFRCGCHRHVPQILSAICRQKSRYLSPCLSLCLSVSLSSCLYLVYLAGSLSVTPCLSLSLSACLPACLSLHLSACLSVFRLPRFRNRNKECTCHIVYRGICHFARIAAANAVGHFSHYISVIHPPLTCRLPICTAPRCNHMHCLCLCAVGACPKLQPVSGAANKQTKIKNQQQQQMTATTTKTGFIQKNLTRLQWKKRQRHNGEIGSIMTSKCSASDAELMMQR